MEEQGWRVRAEQISQVVTDALASNKRIEIEETFGTKTFLLSFAPVTLEGYVNIYAKDITERKKSEAEREIMIEFLRITNTCNDTRGLVKSTLGFFQKQSGCEAVGIRLKEGDDYPYYETRGFLPEHVLLENKLCATRRSRMRNSRLQRRPSYRMHVRKHFVRKI